MGRTFTKTLAALTLITLGVGCSSSSDEASVSTPKSLYVASGACYSGSGITTYTGATSSRAVTKWSTSSGINPNIFTDLNVGNNVSVGTTPQAMIDNGDSVLLLTENSATAGDRKIFKLMKSDTSTYLVHANDPTAFTSAAGHVLRSMALDGDGTITFSKSLFAERVNSLGVRLVKGGANPWINPTAPTGGCFAGVASQIQSLALMDPFTDMNQGKLLYIHAGATAADNVIGGIQRTGLTSGNGVDCAGSAEVASILHTNAPNLTSPISFLGTGASITSMVYIKTPAPAVTTGRLIVSYSASVNTAFDNSTDLNYAIVMWNVTEQSDTQVDIDTPVVLWSDESIVFAPSAMAYDDSSASLYVAVGAAPGVMNQTTSNYGYNIEKFTLDMNTPLLSRVSVANKPYIQGNAYTKCVSHMMIAN